MLLLAAMLLLCRKTNPERNLLPQRFLRGYVIAAVLTAALILASPDNYTQGARSCFRFGTLDTYWARFGRVSGWR